MKIIFLFVLFFSASMTARAEMFEKYTEWKSKPKEQFQDAEKNFHQAMDKLLQQYVDKGLTKEDLYRAATAGMLEALNSGERSWNTLLTPQELSEIQSDLSGKVSGIGIHFKFEDVTGRGEITSVIPNSPSAKMGLKTGDQILSVDGKSFQGKQFRDVVAAIRGKIGESVSLKVLRGDQILSIKLKREVIPWTPVEISKVDSSTNLLTIGYFTEETPQLVEKAMAQINTGKKLIIDLRSNSGGIFDKAVQTAELFIPRGEKIVSTQNRLGEKKFFESKKGLMKKEIKIILLTNAETTSGAELFAGALKDQLNAKIIGEATFGKWNAQMIETLPNGFAIKYTVSSFQTPKGYSYQDRGIKPDLQVQQPKKLEKNDWTKQEMEKRLEQDVQLKAAVEFIQVI